MSQSRPAIILPLGMLLEKVEANSFIMTMIKKAKEKNSAFDFNAVKDKLFLLAENFNLGKISADAFQTQIIETLGISIDAKDFWSEWNKMIEVGNPSDK